VEVDEQGRMRRTEVFGEHMLGDAVARLYERYAELLPDGSARARAAVTARAAAKLLRGRFDPGRVATAFASDIEYVDHRLLGTWSGHGAEAVLQHNRALRELSDDLAISVDEILSLEPDAFLIRRTHGGTARDGGGIYERPFISLAVFGPDGLAARLEYFDVY